MLLISYRRRLWIRSEMRRLRQQRLEVKALLQLLGIRVLSQHQQMDQLLLLPLSQQLKLKRLLLQQLQLMEQPHLLM